MGFSRRRPLTFCGLLVCLFSSSLVFAAWGEENRFAPAPVSADQYKGPAPSSPAEEVIVPGPIRSFLRMAGISQEISPEDVLPTVGRDVYVLGGHGRSSEYLLLLQRYVQQARELQALAGPGGSIRVKGCDDAGPLLEILGYRFRAPCGQKDASLITFDPDRAFLTVDSGFPLTQLEDALQTGAPFTCPYEPTRVPVMFHRTDWANLSMGARGVHSDLLDVLLHDPQVGRLYWALSRIDPETRLALQQLVGLPGLLPHANVLDFYGTQIYIRSHKVFVPGGSAAEPAWEALVGASPRSAGDFVARLLSQDRGWMAVYFDTLARLDATQQSHFTQEPRFRRLYEAFREPSPGDYAAKGSFREAASLLVLCGHQRWAPNGEPVIPGNIDLWKHIEGKHAQHWNRPEQVLEGVVASARLYSEHSLIHIYLTLSQLDNERQPQSGLSPETLLLMAKTYAQFSDWYPVFSEFQELNDASITQFIHVAESLDKISNQELRGDALGIFQANLGLWQILARQGEIPPAQLAASWQLLLDAFAKIDSPVHLVDAGYASLNGLMVAATGKPNRSQNEIIDLLAGPPQKNPQNEKVRMQMASKMRLVMDDQRLTPLDTLFELNRGLSAMAQGGPPSKELLALTGQVREFEMPRRIFSESEKAEWAPGVFNQRHAELQMKTDLAKLLEKSEAHPKVETARGQLAPFLRDTLVGMNYAYYEPPGSQILHINPLFVRRHDFAAETVQGIEHVWQAAELFGAGAPAGGGAYLVGSLAELPYILASAEQDFIAPSNVQALIWQEIVPDLLATATYSRWWNVSPQELRAVALYQQSGEELLNASASDRQLREKVVSILADRMSTLRVAEMEQAMQSRSMGEQIARLLPADSFYLAAAFRERFPQEATEGPAGRALEKLSHQSPTEVNLARLSDDFGIPHPTLAQTYRRELINVKPFPAFSGYFCRTFGESWDSTNLYWARLAVEKGDSPASLNLLSPQLTRLMISRIFASHYEDWPAAVRAMHSAGDEFLQGKLTPPPETETGAQR